MRGRHERRAREEGVGGMRGQYAFFGCSFCCWEEGVAASAWTDNLSCRERETQSVLHILFQIQQPLQSGG